LEECVIERKAQRILEHLPSVKKNSCLPPEAENVAEAKWISKTVKNI